MIYIDLRNLVRFHVFILRNFFPINFVRRNLNVYSIHTYILYIFDKFRRNFAIFYKVIMSIRKNKKIYPASFLYIESWIRSDPSLMGVGGAQDLKTYHHFALYKIGHAGFRGEGHLVVVRKSWSAVFVV